MRVDADLVVRIEGFTLQMGIDVGSGETVALVGPSAAGKTTAIRALAGLTRINAGRIHMDGRVVDDPEAGCFVPPRERHAAVVFQDVRLFPHMSLVDNVAFGLRARGESRRDARAHASEILDALGLEDVRGSRPRAVSGGQARRAAIARALATDPALLLLDEPLTGLDVDTRVSLRQRLGRLLGDEGNRSAVVVTHDPVDALTMADRVVVLENGRVSQTGTVDELARHPASAWIAQLVGINLVHGFSDGETVALDGGGVLVTPNPPRGKVVALFHPSAVALHTTAPEGSPRNVWRGTVSEVEHAGAVRRVRVEGEVPLVAEVTERSVATLGLHSGTEVWCAVKATETEVKSD